MTYLLVWHKVEDFGKWKKAFDRHGFDRREGGSTEARVLRGKEDPNQVVVITRWPTVEAARKFMKAGVSGKPEQILLDEIEFQPH